MITQVIPVTTQAPLTVTRVFSILGRNLFLIEAELGLRRPLFYKLNLIVQIKTPVSQTAGPDDVNFMRNTINISLGPKSERNGLEWVT